MDAQQARTKPNNVKCKPNDTLLHDQMNWCNWPNDILVLETDEHKHVERCATLGTLYYGAQYNDNTTIMPWITSYGAQNIFSQRHQSQALIRDMLYRLYAHGSRII